MVCLNVGFDQMEFFSRICCAFCSVRGKRSFVVKHHLKSVFGLIVAVGFLAVSPDLPGGTSREALDEGWLSPPQSARLRAYWWWINGNVTKEAITRDLEEMKAKGFGGALICDADGSEQDGNARAPHGPTFFSAEWRELYKHTLREAERLGLEMSLNIQSGWNLGGPMVKPEDAPKKLVWTERQVSGGARFAGVLQQPRGRDNFYRDLFVLAWPERVADSDRDAPVASASSSQDAHPPGLVIDGDPGTFWVSSGGSPGQGPTPSRPEWLEFAFRTNVTISEIRVTPRPGYGPRECQFQVGYDEKEFRHVRSFVATEQGTTTNTFLPVTGRFFRLLFRSSYDRNPGLPPRNVQVAECVLVGEKGPLHGARAAGRPLQNQQQKALLAALRPFSAPDSSPLFAEFPATAGEEDTRADAVVDLTSKMKPDGTLDWAPPAGEWRIIRMGFTLNNHCRVSTCSEGWDGYALDPFDAAAFRRYWDAVVEPLILDAGPLAGKALKYLHTDSWEVEVANWTPSLREEFKKRRGYDLLPWLPVISGKIVNSREESNRFLHDFRRTIGDLAIDNHYRLFKEGARKHGLLIHPESGGPHAVPIDAQQCLGFNDAPMSEFWAWSWRHRVGDENRFFVKQPASAAHVYGRKLVLAEAFTTIGPHWQETLWDNLKPSFDVACTEGLNLVVWHAFVCSPGSEGVPGQQYFAGTHLNPLVTWWDKSSPFFSYINRSQFMLQQGLFVADAAYYYGDHVPNFTQLRRTDPARLGTGYDYDVLTAEALLERVSVRDGRIILPDGMSYRILVLPEREVISLPVLRRLKTLAEDGATIVGPRPRRSPSLTGYPDADREIVAISNEMWPPQNGRESWRKVGKGRVITGKTGREVLMGDGVGPDFEWAASVDVPLNYIHRSINGTEIYFVANRSNTAASVVATFRVSGLLPELWNPVTGERRAASKYNESNGRTTLPLSFAPCGSWFVVFRSKADIASSRGSDHASHFKDVMELGGSWSVTFDPEWGGPGTVVFDSLASWTNRSEPGIRFYSGTAVYRKTFELPAGADPQNLWMDLGDLRELAEVKLNGKSCGITWTPPFRLPLDGLARAGQNELIIEVVNFWPNRIIGDASLPEPQRRTRTNIRKLTAETGLMNSGLFGPVKLVRAEEGP